MLHSYRRRAFIVAAVTSMFPVAALADRATASDSLWDLMSRVSSEVVTADIPNQRPLFADTARQPLGPIPGFTVPASPTQDESAGGNKRRRGPFGSIGDWFSRMERATGTKVTATGNSTFSFRADSVSGGETSFQNEQDFGRGSNGFYNNTDVTVDATVLKYFHYQTRLTNTLFHNPNDNRVKLDYKDKHNEFEWGDINAQFQGNSLIDFSRYLHGFKFTREWNRELKTTMLYSATKAEPKTVVVAGNDSSGPYYVYSGQIVEGSEHVRVDNGNELRKGEDFQLDAFTGELKFLNNRIIPHTSTIAISYETLGYNQNQGTIYGGRAQIAATRNLTLGLTYVAQQSQGTNGTQYLTEEQHGLGAPQFYTTQSPIDLSKLFYIYVDGRQLAPGEYTIDKTTTYTNRVFIQITVPFASIVRFQYIPYNANPTPGNRSVLGLDSRLGLGKWGSLTMETALSGLSITGNNVSGNAWQIRADLNPLAKVHTSLALRSVSPTYSSIQSPGFNRNEQALEFATEYSPTSRLHLNVNYTDSLRPSYSSGTAYSTNTNGNDDYSQYGFGLNYNVAKNATLAYNRNSLTTTYVLGGKSNNDSDTLSLNYIWKTLSFDTSLSSNRSNVNSSYALLGLTSTGGSTQSVNTNSNTFSKRFGIGWRPKSWLNLRGSFSDNDISNDSGSGTTHSTARDTSFDAQFSLIKNLRINYAYSLSDTGNSGATSNTTTTGTSTTTNGGTLNGTNVRSLALPPWFIYRALSRDVVAGGTNGASSSSNSNYGSLFGGGSNSYLGGTGNYSGGYGGTSVYNYGQTSYGGKSYQHTVNLDYQPLSNLHLGTQFLIGSSIGDYQFNSSRNDYSFNLFWQPSQRIQMNLTYGVQRTNYTNGQGGSKSNNILVAMQGRPFGGKLDLQVNWSLLDTRSAYNFSSTTTGSTSTPTDTSTYLSTLGAEADYPISGRHTLFVRSLISTTSGYQANTENTFSIGTRYALTRTVQFELGWQLQSHIYKDTSNSGLNYHASSLLANLGFHF